MKNKYIIEGTDGVGKTSTIKELLKEGIICYDRSRDVISKYMLFDIDMEMRAAKYEEFLRNSDVKVIFMTNNNLLEINRRINSREKISEYDKKANEYNKLYLDTFNYMVKNNMTHDNLILIDCTNLTFEEQVAKIKKNILTMEENKENMIVATNNEGKLREIKQIFNEYEIYSLKEKDINIDVLEDADTFYGNALKKAKEIYNIVKEPVLADDSGLCITSLNGFPGVLTHRFLGENASVEDRNINLINRVNNLTDRSAKIVCVMVYYDGNNIAVGEGILTGKISATRRGNNGFGFDEIFELEDGRTLAELSHEEKNKISARYLALIDLDKKIKELNFSQHNKEMIKRRVT